MKTAKRWIVSAGACLLALTSMSVSFGQIPTAPIPEQNNDGLPLLTEPAPLDVAPIAPMQTPAAPADVPAPAVNAVPQATAPAPVAQPAPVVQQSTPLIRPVSPQQPCQQCQQCQTCPDGANYTTTPYYGQDTRPWWLIRPVPYTGGARERAGMGFGGRGVRNPYDRYAPIEPPFYTTRGPRDFYLDNPRPLGY